jgi:dihydropteroate synthase
VKRGSIAGRTCPLKEGAATVALRQIQFDPSGVLSRAHPLLARSKMPCYRIVVGGLESRIKQAISARGAALMGILNVTPDSFYDGGRYADPKASIAGVDALIEAGADIVDVGGESSRPGAESVPAEVQIARIEPAVSHALSRDSAVSIDTTSPEVAERMLALGAHAVNDVSCLRDVELASVCAKHEATLILMHVRGSMRDMRGFSEFPDQAYSDVVGEVLSEWRSARDRALGRGVPREKVWLDPGIGFGKNARHSFEVLRRLDRFMGEGAPVVVGTSRKSFIRAIDDSAPEARLGGSIASALLAVDKGASVLRVHDVHAVRQALLVARAIRGGLEAAHA